jgi:methyl-accepting chemotaxis protein
MKLRTKIISFVLVLFLALLSIDLLGLKALRHASETDNLACRLTMPLAAKFTKY